MNKLSVALILLASLLCACAADPLSPSDTDSHVEQTTDNGAETPTVVPDETAHDGFALTIDGTRLIPGAAVDVEGLLGTAEERLEAPSCVHEGNDIVYYYDGFEVVTSPGAAGDTIVSITVTGEGIAAEEGFSVGDAFADVALETPADNARSAPDFGRYVYVRGKTSLTLLVTDDVITSISYSVEGE